MAGGGNFSERRAAGPRRDRPGPCNRAGETLGIGQPRSQPVPLTCGLSFKSLAQTQSTMTCVRGPARPGRYSADFGLGTPVTESRWLSYSDRHGDLRAESRSPGPSRRAAALRHCQLLTVRLSRSRQSLSLSHGEAQPRAGLVRPRCVRQL